MLLRNVTLSSGNRRLQCWLPDAEVPKSKNARVRLRGKGIDPETWWKIDTGERFVLDSSHLRTDWAPYV